jgi:hypothetical protein
MKRHLIVTVAFALIIVTAPNARAAMCFQYTKSGGGISVAQATLPEPNKCITFALYEVGDKPGTTLLGAGTGSLCRSTQSNFVIFHYTYDACMPLAATTTSSRRPAGFSQSRDLGLPTAFSHCRGTVTSGKPGEVGKVGNFYYTDDLVISSCDSNDIKFRVPDGEISECRGLGLRLQNSDQLGSTPDQPKTGPEQR